MQNKPAIAVVILIFGIVGLVAALGLMALAYIDAPRGGTAPFAALAYLPHVGGALVVIGFAKLIEYAAELVHETGRARAEAVKALGDIRNTIEAQALAAEERELPWEALDRAHKAGWAIEAKGQGQWTAKHATAHRLFPHRGALEDFIRTLPPAA